jgi:hypothetical protein
VVAKSRKKNKKRTATGTTKPGPQATPESSPPGDDEERHGPWYAMARGGKWLVVTAALAAVSTATTLAVNKLGDRVTKPGDPEGPPVAVASVSLVAKKDGSSFALPQPVGLDSDQLLAIQANGPPEHSHPGRFDRFLSEHNGVVADESGATVAQITLRGNSADQVRILDLQALPRCRPALTGTLFYSPNQGQSKSASLGFDLDQPHPVAKTYSWDKGLGHDYFPARTISLNPKEQQVLAVYARTRGYCEYRIRLKVLVGDKTIYETIGNGRKVGDTAPPFRFTAMSITGDHVGRPESLSSYGRLYVSGGMTNDCKISGRWVDETSGFTGAPANC